MFSLLRLAGRLASDDEAATMVEYAVMLGLISAALVAAVSAVAALLSGRLADFAAML